METQVIGIRKHYAEIDYQKSVALPTTPIGAREAMIAARRLHSWALGRSLSASDCQLTTGNRYTWMRRGILYVNAERGWRRLAHDLSHLFWREANPGERPHSKHHAKFEAKLIREIRKRGYIDGRLTREKPVIAEPSPDEAKAAKRAEKIDRLRIRKASWERKAKRAETALRKINRSLAYYETH